MTYVKLFDDYYDHPKFCRVSPLAETLYVRCLAWASRNLTDGRVPMKIVAQLAPQDVGEQMTQGDMNDVQYARGVLASELVEAALWEEKPGGFQIHDYLEFNKSREYVLNKRAKDSARKRNGTVAEATRTIRGEDVEARAR